ncbi:putative Flp pilus assembly protein TadF [Vibrio tapetis subsp. tapetis]|uniref:Putative Flp pilus assembly protein TadF n=1 Tax=Vibrio tapetis subsp. tapetis TaxID=1671868 RepID=A0A2N8ZLG0_9VIBR|nr:putative Flp pilus assembly protein TadF [Vibrio tapetis subsp. tapetis]
MKDVHLRLARGRVVRVKQKGSFAVELAMVLVFASGIFLVVVNYMIAINKKGQLDRATYSLTTILSERKQLFDADMNICAGNCRKTENTAFVIASASMKRMIPNFDKTKFGMRIDEIRLEEDLSAGGKVNYRRVHKTLTKGNIHGCEFPNMSDVTKDKAIDMLPVTSKGRRLPLYQVSLCYEIPTNLLGVASGEVFRLVSSSYSFARV